MADDFTRNLYCKEKYMIADSEQKHRNNPNRMSDVEIMVISILFDSGGFCCFRHYIIRSMFANIWNGCFYVRYPIIVSYNWSRKYCFLWLFSSRKYCRELVPTSVLLTQLSCVSVVTWESWFIRHLKAFAGVENILSDGYRTPVTSNN